MCPLTSSSPFPVSWNTPVFCDVSRCDLSALFPIRTRTWTGADAQAENMVGQKLQTQWSRRSDEPAFCC